MEKICENCKFWDITKQYPLKEGQIGECKRVKMFWDNTEWFDNEDGEYRRRLIENSKNDKAFVQDGSDYMAQLLTLTTFGCNQFEQKW